MKYILAAFIFLFQFAGHSQALLSVDKTEINIGDQINVTIKADLSQGKDWVNSETLWPDSLKGIEVVHGPVWNRENPNAVLATWTIAFFDTGWVRIPPLPVIINQQDHFDTLFTNDVPVKVNAVEPDSTGLRDIKEIYVQPFSFGYYKRYLPHAAVILLILAGIFFWWRHRVRKQVVPEAIPLPLLPHEWAYAALNELAERKLWQRGEVKEHYSFLTAILREYLERRYNIHALEQTSAEIIAQLKFQHLSTPLLQDTEELLSIADLIKFAKADPGMDIHSETIERVRGFVKETTLHFLQPENDAEKHPGNGTVE